MDILTQYGPTQVARWAGCKPPSVMGWRKTAIPADRCPALERGTEGRFTCEQIRPDIAWVRIPDTSWPWHPDGRPCIDVARPVAAEGEQRAAA